MVCLLDVFGRRGHIAPELIARPVVRFDLAVLAREPVAADHRDVAAGHIAPADLDDHRRALLDPAPALDRGLGGPEIEQRAYRLAQRALPREVGLQRAANIVVRGVFWPLAATAPDQKGRVLGKDGYCR